jgi:hypothetical protein
LVLGKVLKKLVNLRAEYRLSRLLKDVLAHLITFGFLEITLQIDEPLMTLDYFHIHILVGVEKVSERSSAHHGLNVGVGRNVRDFEDVKRINLTRELRKRLNDP